tara:strand:- start:875 stop:1855 length:981 start_codon:yes stop_codon:yes gene_type:complete
MMKGLRGDDGKMGLLSVDMNSREWALLMGELDTSNRDEQVAKGGGEENGGGEFADEKQNIDHVDFPMDMLNLSRIEVDGDQEGGETRLSDISGLSGLSGFSDMSGFEFDDSQNNFYMDVGNVSTFVYKDPSPARKAEYDVFFESLNIEISKDVWWYFVKLCEIYIPASQDASHFTFRNQIAACFFCATIVHSLPISRKEIIEIHVDITGKRFQRELPPIMTGENLFATQTDEHISNFVWRLVEETNVYVKSAQHVLSRVEMMRDAKFGFDLVGLETAFLIICVFSSFLSLDTSDDKKIQTACLLFGKEKTKWLTEKCKSIQTRFVG